MIRIDHEDAPAQYLNSGRWVVRRVGKARQWTAWADWLHREYGRTFFPDAMQMLFEWPPTTQEGADMVTDSFVEMRKSIGWGREVPRAAPWRGQTFAASA